MKYWMSSAEIIGTTTLSRRDLLYIAEKNLVESFWHEGCLFFSKSQMAKFKVKNLPFFKALEQQNFVKSRKRKLAPLWQESSFKGDAELL